jgi:hypothetical protein
MLQLLARLMHQCTAPHRKDGRFGRVRAAGGGYVHRSIEPGTTSKNPVPRAESRQRGHLIGIAIPAAQQATVFKLFRLAPELDDARDLDDFVCRYTSFEW